MENNLRKIKKPVQVSRRIIFECSMLAAVLFLNAVALSNNAFQCFNLYDMGTYLDATWRIYSGQRPHIDFIFPMPALHWYMECFFFKIFGFNQAGIFAYLNILTAITAGLTFVTLRQRVPVWLNGLITLLTVAALEWNTAHPWCEQSAHFWGILGILGMVWFLTCPTRSRATLVGFGCGVVAVLAFMAKMNIGGAYGLVFLLMFLNSYHRWEAIRFYIIGLFVGLGVSMAFGIRFTPEFFDQITIFYQFTVKGRFEKLLTLKAIFINYYWVALVLVGFNLFFQTRKHIPFFLLLAGVTFIGIFSVQTSSTDPQANIFIRGIQIAIAFLVVYAGGARDTRLAKLFYTISKYVLIIWTFLLTLESIALGLDVRTWRYEPKSFGGYAIQSPPLTGWLTSVAQGKPLDEMTNFVKASVPQKDSLLNLSDMYVIYLLTNRQSYLGIPVGFLPQWGHPAPGRQTQMVREHILADPPDWVIIKKGSPREEVEYLGLSAFIQEKYKPFFRTGLYFLLQREKTGRKQ